MSGLDNSQPITDKQSLDEGHVVQGHETHPDEAADKLGRAVREHTEAEVHAHEK
ncbi:MAG: hypothetical protein JWL64_1726 [Frankiales bacterium]|nr:hypothetical protein [Frankiales bacterium]